MAAIAIVKTIIDLYTPKSTLVASVLWTRAMPEHSGIMIPAKQ